MTYPVNFESYVSRYENIHLKRNDGILEVHFGKNEVYSWNKGSYTLVSELFGYISNDPENMVVILRGNDEFWVVDSPFNNQKSSNISLDTPIPLEVFLDIEIPVIAVIPGSLGWFCEIPLMADIVLASERSQFIELSFQQEHLTLDSAVRRGVIEHILGPRSRYFKYAVQPLSAIEAKTIGIISELHQQSDLLNRAKELSFMLMRRDSSTLRILKKDSLKSIKKQIQKMKQQVSSGNFDSPSSNNKRLNADNSQKSTSNNLIKNPSLPSQNEVFHQEENWAANSTEDSKKPAEYDGFSLHGSELNEIVEDQITTQVDSKSASDQLQNDELSVNRVISSLSNEGNEGEVKLNLAKAYIELGLYQSAELILDELMNDYGDVLKEEIESLNAQISGQELNSL